MIRPLTPLLLSCALVGALNAQQPAPAAEHQHDHHAGAVEGGGVLPAGWSARPDEGTDLKGVKLENMAPGWHVTMGTSAILYRDKDQATAPFHTVAKMHLFPGSGATEEAFGLFIGGQDLSAVGQRYTYFLIRGDGTFKIKRRNGDNTTDVTAGWTASSAIKKADAKDAVANQIEILAKPDKVSFSVNGTEVWSGPASSVDLNGIVGLRMNHNLSIHVESFEIHKL